MMQIGALLLLISVLSGTCTAVPAPPITAGPPTTSATTEPEVLGCLYNDQMYPPDTWLEEGYNESYNWCWRLYCDSHGKLLYWDNFNCFPEPDESS